MNKSQRISINKESLEDNHIKVKLEQDVDFFEFMSLKIDTKEFYENFNANYGVLVGRVVANEGVGIPNARISIFIPLQEEDENDNTIVNLYPYKTPRDRNRDGKRYNLLPRVSTINPEDNTIQPKQAFGSFPIKPEIVTNPSFMKVYKKYYKYTTTTNNVGDYMIFGVPTGIQTVHLSVDITDIGDYSMTPAAMVTNLGYSDNLFTDNNTRIKPSEDLDDLPHIETQEISVDIIPFWGDTENFEIGITRQDFRIRARLMNTFTIFGTVFTDGTNHMWGNNASKGRLHHLYERRNLEHLELTSKRIGKITEKIYYYPNTVTDDELITIQETDPNGNRMLLLDPSEYSVFKRDGDFVVIVNCNRRKVITDEFGDEQVVDDSSTAGVFTEFKGFMTLEYTVDDLPMDFQGEIGGRTIRPLRMRVKIPQKSQERESHAMYAPNPNAVTTNNAKWRHEHFTFKAQNIYSIAKFNPVVKNVYSSISRPSFNSNIGFFDDSDDADVVNHPKDDANFNSGILLSEISDTTDTGEEETDTNILIGELPHNCVVSEKGFSGRKAFGANWLNFAIYLPQVGYLSPTTTSTRFNNSKTNTMFAYEARRIGGNDTVFEANNNPFIRNNIPLAAGQINTAWFGRSDLHWTDFIETPKNVLTELLKVDRKGFDSTYLNTITGFDGDVVSLIEEKFKSARTGANSVPLPLLSIRGSGSASGRFNGTPNGAFDTKVYIYRGLNTADCLRYLEELNII